MAGEGRRCGGALKGVSFLHPRKRCVHACACVYREVVVAAAVTSAGGCSDGREMCVCARARACVRACVHAYVHVRARFFWGGLPCAQRSEQHHASQSQHTPPTLMSVYSTYTHVSILHLHSCQHTPPTLMSAYSSCTHVSILHLHSFQHISAILILRSKQYACMAHTVPWMLVSVHAETGVWWINVLCAGTDLGTDL